ncbi:ENV9 [Scenedesmus sp. PABB004]|nr:ENV9 [Scenedesmus sp. PABB004]
MHRVDALLDHSLGVLRTFESCVQPRPFFRSTPPRPPPAAGRAPRAAPRRATRAAPRFDRFAPPKVADLRGKVAVVTGGSSGVAKEVARDLAARGATVYAGCRRTHLVPTGTYALGAPTPAAALALAPALAADARRDLGAAQGSAAAAVLGGASRLSPGGVVASAGVAAPAPDGAVGAVHALHLNLADTASVEAFAGRVLEAAGRVDMLVLCAAIAGKPYKLSPQGFELHWATNFLGHFALTQHLLPALLDARARVVVVSSILHTYAEDAGPHFTYPAWPALLGVAGGWSNLAKTWFGYELQRRRERARAARAGPRAPAARRPEPAAPRPRRARPDPELTVPLCHPGVIDSGLTVVPTAALQRVKAGLLISPVDGARTPLYCALSPDAVGGQFYHNVLGIIPSSSMSYDVARSGPSYEAALSMMWAHKNGGPPGGARRSERAAPAAAPQAAAEAGAGGERARPAAEARPAVEAHQAAEMGLLNFNLASMLGNATPEKPKTVLVPPMFERDVKARSRMVKSSYDYLFAKPALRWLFGDYFGPGLNASLLFAPSLDPRLSVKAKLRAGDAGTMSIRYQPFGLAEPLCFVDIKASPQSPGDVTLRACAFSTDTGLGAFATMPLAKDVSGKRAEVGVRYSSPVFTAGAALAPATNTLRSLWLCGRQQGVTRERPCARVRRRRGPGRARRRRAPPPPPPPATQAATAARAVGVQVRPELAVHNVGGCLSGALAALPASCGGDAADVASWLRSVSSVALSYSPEGLTRAGQHSFTATMEMAEGREFIISFFQHMTAVRQVFNPLERDDVIGITSYVDVGLQLNVPLAAEAAAKPGAAGSAAGAAGLRLAGAWQVNKNVYLKGRLGADGVSVVAAFKSWFQPSLAVAGVLERSFATGATRAGVTVQVENFGRLRYERSREAMEHGRVLTQRHEATSAEVAMAAGDRPLVGQLAADGEFNAPEPASVTFM